MRMHLTTMGKVKIKDASTDGDYICAIEMIDEEGSSFSIDMTPASARDIGIQLLERAGAVTRIDTTREVLLGARH
jgi:hypothetical protein